MNSRLILKQTVFRTDDPIPVTAYGDGRDWVGIYAKGETPGNTGSIRWYYVAEDSTSGSETDLRMGRAGTREGALTPGEYRVFLLLDDGYTVAESADLTILPPAATEFFDIAAERVPDKPVSVVLDLPKAADGLAEGSVTVELPEHCPWADDLYLYWAEKDGTEPLNGYTYLSRAHTAGRITVFSLPAFLVIPEKAGRILACAKNRRGISPFASADLPADKGILHPGSIRTRFQAVSDLHITADENHEHNRHFVMMLKDILAVCPESAGIMAAGDIADHGDPEQYEWMKDAVSSMPGVPDFHFVIGNHDVSFRGDFASQLEQFNRYLGNDRLYYDLWLEGFHYVFFAGEDGGAPIPIPREELAWMEEKLAENGSHDKPVFLFCHESVMNTVAGSTPEEGWWGIANGDELAAVLAKYPNAIVFSGHSHWELSSKNEMFPADGKMCNAFNTSSVGYLWTGYNVVPGEYLCGSEGLYVEVYDNLTLVRGRDFVNGLWSASAQYVVFHGNERVNDGKADV